MFTRALLIGIDRYRTRDGQFMNLRGCKNDQQLMLDTLKESRACSREPVILQDDQATTRAVLSALDAWSSGVAPGEQLFLHYSGHGVRVPDLDEDEEDGYDESFVPYDFSKVEPVLDDLFRSYLDRIPAGASATLILDCCHSGGLPRASQTFVPGVDPGQPRSGQPISRAEYTPPEIEQLKSFKQDIRLEPTEQNAVAITACQPDEEAWEYSYEGRRQGILTYSLCKAFRESGPRLSHRQAIDSAFRFIRENRKPQTPRLVGNELFFDRALLG